MDYIELLKIMLGAVAGIATVAAVVYTWAWLKTRPVTWTLTGLMIFLWMIAFQLWSQRYVVWMESAITSDEIAKLRVLFIAGMLVGYVFFLLGTYNSGPIRKPRPK